MAHLDITSLRPASARPKRNAEEAPKEPRTDEPPIVERLESPIAATFKAYHQMIEQHGSDVRKETVGGGDAAVGTVNHFRQMHPVDGVTGHEDRLAIGRIQEKILRDLLKQKLSDVFVESRTVEFYPGEKETMKEIVDSYLPNRKLPDKLSDSQLLMLSAAGAAAVYRELTGAHLHPTMTPEEYSRFVEPQLAQIQRGEEHTDTSTEREQAAGREVMNFIQKNQGASVGLIFGAHHFFEKDTFMSPIGMPEIHDISWPGLLTTAPIGASQFVSRLQVFPELQTEFLRRVTAIRSDCFPDIKTDAGQLLALEKMIPLRESPDDTRSFASEKPKEFFLQTIRSPQVKAELETIYAREAKQKGQGSEKERDTQEVP